MRVLGLDIGTARIGVALSDESLTIASPLTTIAASDGFASIAAAIRDICFESDVQRIVVGLPLSLSGEDRGKSARMARELGDRLGEVLGIEIVYVDERFTTAEAERALVGADVSRNKRKKVVDKVAAALLLQTHLDSRSGHER